MDIYAFPYNKVPHGSNIIIYGAGAIGQTYIHQIITTQYCNLLCVADKDPSVYKSLSVKVLDICEALERKYDYIIIANSSSKIADEITIMLINEYDVSSSKIIYENKYLEPIHVVRCDENELYDRYVERMAVSQKGAYAISIHLEGGFGDYIVRKNNIREVSNWNKNILIDIYVGKGKKSFTERLLSDVSNINMITEDDALYYISKKEYLAAFRFTAFLIVDSINDLNNDSIPVALRRKLQKIQVKYEDYALKEAGLQFAIHYARCRKDGVNCYTAYNRYEAFDVKNQKTSIPMMKEYESDFIDVGSENNLKAAFMGHAHNVDWTVDYKGVTIGLGVKTGTELYFAHVDASSELPEVKSGLASTGISENFDLIGASLVTLTSALGTFDLEHLYLNERANGDFVKWVAY